MVIGAAVVVVDAVVGGGAVVGAVVVVEVGAAVSVLPPQADATRTNAMTAGSVLIP